MNKKYFLIAAMIVSIFVAGSYRQSILFDEHKQTTINMCESEKLNRDQCINLCNSIDLNRTIITRVLNEGDVVYQWQTPNSPQGCYYSYNVESPSKLGISEIGYDPVIKDTIKKEVRKYIVVKPITVLISYTSPIVDDWSTKEIETQTKGHALQIFTTCKECFKLQHSK